MRISISNQVLKASFASKGAELQSLVHQSTAINYLWAGDARYWGKFSPVLFPIVGALKNNSYTFNRQTYCMPRHGFARDMDFSAEKIAEDEILFSLGATPETLKIYPFTFRLSLRYKLVNNQLFCTYEVYNPAAQNLFFSIGGHPAFAVPLTQNTAYTDYYLQFNKDENLEVHQVLNNLIGNATTSIKLNEGKLPLKRQLFANDALVFKTLKSDAISLLNTENQHGLKFTFPNFPYFGIWAAKNANFLCLEPWCGIADSVLHDQELSEKEGIISLSPHTLWQRTWAVACF